MLGLLNRPPLGGFRLREPPRVWFIPGSYYNTVFPRIIARGDYFFFRPKRGRLFEGRWLFEGVDYFQILFTGSRALNILFYFPIKSKNNHIKETEHGLFKCSKFGSLFKFHCQYPLRCHWSVLLDQTPIRAHPPDLPLWVSIGGYVQWWEGAIFRGRRLFQIFPLKGGDYSRSGD